MIKKIKQIKDYKGLTDVLPAVRMVDPEFVYIPVINARCKTAEVFVEEGETVKMGQVIGQRNGGFFVQPIHATISGTIMPREKKFHRTGRKLECIVIKNDFKDTYSDAIGERPKEDIDELTQSDITEILKQNSVVGLGGSGFPTYIKFQTTEDIHTVYINGIECEPYLTSDYRLILDFPERIYKGIAYILQGLKADKAVIAVKENKKSLYNILKRVKIKFPDLPVEIKKVGNYYPQGWEVEMFKTAGKIKVESGVLPMKYGVIGFNVSTVVAIYKAVKYNMPVLKRYFTITGDAVTYPQNFRVRIGTDVRSMLKKCLGYSTDENKVVIMGGPMMGASVVSDDVIVSKTSTSVIILKDQEYKEEPCVRCGSCVYSCPVNLQPQQIMSAVKGKNVDALKYLNVNSCIECGLCTYVCTSKIHVTEYMRKAKRMVK